jgi:vacuolar-type H+-ATPase subunit I/STV1
MKTFDTISSYVLTLVIIASTVYYFKEDWRNFIFPFVPCEKPITYTLGDFDERFSMNRQELIDSLAEAEEIWEEALGKDLFSYSDTGTVKVNLIYDYRQQATDKLVDVGGSIHEDKILYDKAKVKYDGLVKSYENRKKEYEDEVTYWNDRGGAPEKEYQELKQEADRLNNLLDEINRAAKNLNNLSDNLNEKVKTYNTIGQSTGEEFNEGEYVLDENGSRINIYQFETHKQLIHLLQHEFGHALGLDHVENPQAIMYRLNISTAGELTADDIMELNKVCNNS